MLTYLEELHVVLKQEKTVKQIDFVSTAEVAWHLVSETLGHVCPDRSTFGRNRGAMVKKPVLP